ncbi:hypothetical protein SUDANB171_01317 [Streptomyces sp. enrichment culture]|jgi:catechol 2,3-dioxygenase-like lactoylglutathione lyase family enzyme|uniref:VOC family protein n=1 Tax=Streptomyces xiamenensis TaxID=408015 RepID=UPI0037D67746
MLLRLTATVLEAPDANELAAFYRRLLGWATVQEETGWVRLVPPGGGAGISFNTDPDFVRPVWPAARGDQRMTQHLDIEVEDLAAAGAHARSCGAVPAEYQPQEDVRVYFDPAGHPFCLWVERSRAS